MSDERRKHYRMYTGDVYIQHYNEAMLDYFTLTDSIEVRLVSRGVAERNDLRLVICDAVVYLFVDTLSAKEDTTYRHTGTYKYIRVQIYHNLPIRSVTSFFFFIALL